MAGRPGKDSREQDAEKAQEKKTRLEPAPVPMKALGGESISPPGLLGVSATEPEVERHVALVGDPRFSHPANAVQRACIVTGLQHSYGNAYVQRLLKFQAIQAKLTVNPPDDEYEREADRVAGVVAQTTDHQIERQAGEEEEEIQMKVIGNGHALQRQAEEEEEAVQIGAPGVEEEETEEEEAEGEGEEIQTEAVNGQVPTISENLETRIETAQGGGQPLPSFVRASLEPSFGHLWRKVHIHTDAEAGSLSRELGAMAFTTGRHVFFREGAYDPYSEAGRRLIAHELTHVAQQRASEYMVERQAKEGLTLGELPQAFGSGNVTYKYAGAKALKNANARWEGRYDIRPVPAKLPRARKKKDGLWYSVLNRFNMKVKYWVNSKTKWNRIANFPGGAYNPAFNTRWGSRVHEVAEIKAVRALWRTMQKNIKGNIKAGFKAKAQANANFLSVWNKEWKVYRPKQLAISNHSNPVGPKAEWSFYKKAFDKYKASIKKKAPKKGP